MEIYKIGKVVEVGEINITFEQNGSGYIFNLVDTSSLEVNQEIKLYFDGSIGFLDAREFIIFKKLKEVDGIGDFKALEMIKIGWENILDFVASGNIDEIHKINYIRRVEAMRIVNKLRTAFIEIKEEWSNV